jgi:hypothetical protein
VRLQELSAFWAADVFQGRLIADITVSQTGQASSNRALISRVETGIVSIGSEWPSLPEMETSLSMVTIYDFAASSSGWSQLSSFNIAPRDE